MLLQMLVREQSFLYLADRVILWVRQSQRKSGLDQNLIINVLFRILCVHFVL